jgi:uncharacterized membrane protein
MKTRDKIWFGALGGLTFCYFLFALTLGLSYHWGYLSTLTDLGTFDQAVWSLLNNDFFNNTNIFNEPIKFLGFHITQIFIFAFPFYYFLPKAEWLIIAQSMALSLTGVPIFLIAKEVLKSNILAFFWAIIFFLNPFVLNTFPWIFGPERLAVPFIAFALLAIEKRNFLLLLFSSFFILACKEHFGPMVMGFGILWGIKNKDLKKGAILIVLGFFYSFLVLSIIMPSLSPTGKHVMLSSGLGQVSRYAWLGNSFGEILRSLIQNPLFIVQKLFEMGSFNYVVVLVSFFLFFPLAAPEFFFAMSSDLFANILSSNPMPRALIAYHSVTLIPILTVAAIYAVPRLSFVIKRFSKKEFTDFVLLTSIGGGYFLAPLPLPGSLNY